jgi:hypothetical protein
LGEIKLTDIASTKYEAISCYTKRDSQLRADSLFLALPFTPGKIPTTQFSGLYPVKNGRTLFFYVEALTSHLVVVPIATCVCYRVKRAYLQNCKGMMYC